MLCVPHLIFSFAAREKDTGIEGFISLPPGRPIWYARVRSSFVFAKEGDHASLINHLSLSASGIGLLLIPGPSVLYIITRSVAQGRRAGFTSVLGIELAGLIHASAAALGLSALLLTSALAFNVVKYLGAAYLIYLGVRTLLARVERQQTSIPTPRSFSQLLSQGFLVNLLNPKRVVFFYAFLPQFVNPARGAAAGQILLLGVLFVLLASCTDSLYALLGSSVGHWLTRNVRFRRIQRYVTGSIYIALGLTAAIAGSEKK